MIFGEPDPHTWTDFDYQLVEAYQTLQDETCSCGNPVWLCRVEHRNVKFTVIPSICYAQAEIAKPINAKKQGPGVSLVAIPSTYDGSPLPGREESMRIAASGE